MEDRDLCHGHNSIYATYSSVSEVRYNMATSLRWNDHVLNIVDTPGHPEFRAEAQHAILMVEGVLLIHDINKPVDEHARVITEAVRANLSLVVLLKRVEKCNNASDLNAALDLEVKTNEVRDLVRVLLAENNAPDKIIYGFPVLHDMSTVLDQIINVVPAPPAREKEPFQITVSKVQLGDKWGRFITGKVSAGVIVKNGKVKAFQPSLQEEVVIVKNEKVKAFQPSLQEEVVIEQVSSATGTVTEAALIGLQKLGTIFVSAGDEVYRGMILGQHSRHNNIYVTPHIIRLRKKELYHQKEQ